MDKPDKLDDLLTKAANGGLKKSTKNSIKECLKEEADVLKDECTKEPKSFFKRKSK